MTFSNSVVSQKEYLKKYLSGDEVKKKKKKKKVSSTVKRSKIVDDDIDLKSMRPLDDDEVDIIYQMDEEGPQIAGIVDERPPEVKAQEYYNSKRWKIFGAEDGVSVLDNLDTSQIRCPNSEVLKNSELESNRLNKNESVLKTQIQSFEGSKEKCVVSKIKRSHSSDSDISLPRKGNVKSKKYSDKKKKYASSDSDHSFYNRRKHYSQKSDSDISPSGKNYIKTKYDSDASPPRRLNVNEKNGSDTDTSLPRNTSQYSSKEMRRKKCRSDSDNSPPRQNKLKETKFKGDSDNSPPRKVKESIYKDKFCNSKSHSHSMKKEKYESRKNNYFRKDGSRRNSISRSSSDSDISPPRRDRGKSSNIQKRETSRSGTLPVRGNQSQPQLPSRSTSRLSRKDLMNEINVKRHFSDSDDPPPRSKKSQSPTMLSLKDVKHLKKSLYKPNDSSSSDETNKHKKKKMKTTLDGKQAGLQDAKELKKELSSLKMKEDLMFLKMDASVSGVGAAPVKRDRKTGQVRDIEKEKELEKEKEAKASVVNEKYYKWGKGLKQVEDAATRTAEVMKEMNKPLARYVDDKDLDDYLKAQEREGDPMLDYIKQKQSEATALTGAKPVYQGSFNPNRFGIRPGHRWDGVVRSSGYEKEWFTHQNAKKARDEEAYKWSTSDM